MIYIYSKGNPNYYKTKGCFSDVSQALVEYNLKDIETLTSNYTLDSDELFANLNQIADKIKVGQDIVPDAKQYSNPEYTLTQSDRVKSGGFGDLF